MILNPNPNLNLNRKVVHAKEIMIKSKIKIMVRFVKLCESGGESPPSLGGWSA